MDIMRILILACAFLGLTAPRPATSDQAGFANRIVMLHNKERTRAGLPGLRWNPELAREASEWAAVLVRRQILQHADRSETGGAGENLWMGTAGYYSLEEMVGGFISEKQDFRAGRFPDVSRTGNWADVGHYTQIIWPSTKEVGCAVARGGGQDVLVCRYWPAGNVMGRMVGGPRDGRTTRRAR